VTHYEKVTREEIARRNYSEGTTRAYLRALQDLAGYFERPPEQLSPEQIREYTAHLLSDRKLSGNTVNQMVGALRFFYLTVLNKPWRGHELPYPKKSVRLPVIWSAEEIARLIDAAPTPFYRTILMTLYATGMRRAEVAALKVCDVDSARMVLHVKEGKGDKDRDVVLSRCLLEELRQHYRRLRRKPAVWLFPGGTHHTAECLASTTKFHRVDSSLLLPSAAHCLMKNVTRPRERDGWQIEEAIERDNEAGTD
jgi:integrase/recombinase XerD